VDAPEIIDLELARVIRGREHWTCTGEMSVTYCPPGSDREVRVRRLAQGTMRHRYVAILMIGGRPGRSLQTLGAGELVIWAERLVRSVDE
jgi:hypothetical protein